MLDKSPDPFEILFSRVSAHNGRLTQPAKISIGRWSGRAFIGMGLGQQGRENWAELVDLALS
jgi:hypothetical protein